MIHSLIPIPHKVTPQPGSFTLDPSTRLTVNVDKADVQFAADCAAELWTGTRPRIVRDTGTSSNTLSLRLHRDTDRLGPEGYTLQITSDRIEITSSSSAGLFYGVQTLRQLFRASSSPRTVTGMAIEDRPRFSWRGMMLDVSRNYFPVDFLKRYVDILSHYKINRFHLHLTDDHGWRVEIDRYPRLTRQGAWREVEGKPRGGFYTRKELQNLVAYAAERHVLLIPEIDLPGHATAALTAYPEFSCTGGPFELWTEPGISEDPYCLGNPDVLLFLEHVFEGIIDIFPGDYIHIGGDEAHHQRWMNCKKCRALMQAENLHTGVQLQSWIMHRMCQFLTDRGRKPIVWDDVVEGCIPDNSTIMYWQDGKTNHHTALRAGHDVIMTPTTHCYFDYKQADSEAEPGQIGVVPLEQAYAFDPMPEGLSEAEQAHILGGQANVWTELMSTPERVDYMVFPRLCALAESVWSPGENKHSHVFLERLNAHENFFAQSGIQARPLDRPAGVNRQEPSL